MLVGVTMLGGGVVRVSGPIMAVGVGSGGITVPGVELVLEVADLGHC